MIIVKHTDRVSRGSFSVTRLTEVGQEIFDNLRVPVDMDHVSWVLELLESSGWETELWGRWEKTGPVDSETQRWPFKVRYEIDHRRTSSQSAAYTVSMSSSAMITTGWRKPSGEVLKQAA